MLIELEAIAFEHQITFESRTHPWVILAHRKGFAPEPYVVKLFSKEEVEKRFTVAKEVFASVISKEFELSRPEPALINMSTAEFISTLSDDLFDVINSKDYRIKFACRYLSGTLPYNKNVPLKYYDKYSDIDSVFAFDNLIHNTDRNIGKPDNIRFYDDTFYLIDHEYSLSITKSILDEFDKDNWVYHFTNHIFYDYLLLQKDKSNYFEHFETKIQTFNSNILDSYETQLRKHQYDPPYHDYKLLKNYLDLIKLKSKSFIRILEKICRK